jgi:hypothetical protein
MTNVPANHPGYPISLQLLQHYCSIPVKVILWACQRLTHILYIQNRIIAGPDQTEMT